MADLLKADLEPEPKLEKPRRWRGVMWASEEFWMEPHPPFDPELGGWEGPGLVIGKVLWPSEDIARDKTIQWIEEANKISKENGATVVFLARDPFLEDDDE